MNIEHGGFVPGDRRRLEASHIEWRHQADRDL